MVKDPLPKEKLAQCGKVYVGETQRYLETRVEEHRNKGDTEKSVIAEYQWDQ